MAPVDITGKRKARLFKVALLPCAFNFSKNFCVIGAKKAHKLLVI